eukprot:m.948362 g.948362  ORF g.948362 m.948362 type:complete len:64 (+) comp23850_c0_seq26:3189-3380(+)
MSASVRVADTPRSSGGRDPMAPDQVCELSHGINSIIYGYSSQTLVNVTCIHTCGVISARFLIR